MNDYKTEDKNRMVLDKYCECRDLLIRYVASRLPDPSDAEDIVQDVFVRIWTRIDRIDVRTLRPLMFTIASNLIGDIYRRSMCHKEYHKYMESCDVEYTRADDSLKYNELLRRHNETLRSLPTKRRKIYEKSFYEGCCNPEIAAAFGISVRTVESQLLYSRQFIRASLAEFYQRGRRV